MHAFDSFLWLPASFNKLIMTRDKATDRLLDVDDDKNVTPRADVMYIRVDRGNFTGKVNGVTIR